MCFSRWDKGIELSPNSTAWQVWDTGCSAFMTNDRAGFINLKPHKGKVRTARKGIHLDIKGIGTYRAHLSVEHDPKRNEANSEPHGQVCAYNSSPESEKGVNPAVTDSGEISPLFLNHARYFLGSPYINSSIYEFNDAIFKPNHPQNY